MELLELEEELELEVELLELEVELLELEDELLELDDTTGGVGSPVFPPPHAARLPTKRAEQL